MTRKRGQNEGSIFQRRDGRWCAVLNLGLENGKRTRKYIYGATAAEVRELMTKSLRDRDLRVLPKRGASPTIAQFLNNWLATIKSSVRIRS